MIFKQLIITNYCLVTCVYFWSMVNKTREWDKKDKIAYWFTVCMLVLSFVESMLSLVAKT